MSASWSEIKGAFQGLNLTIRGVQITITPTSTYSAKEQVARLEYAISGSLSTSKLDWVCVREIQNSHIQREMAE
jgi:hypothetical protein